MSHHSFTRATSTLAATALLSACAGDSISAPTFVQPALVQAPALAVVGAPNLGDARSMEGKLYVCKDGTPSATNFSFDYSLARQSDGVVVNSGTVVVPMGQCVVATTISTVISGRFRATVTEQLPPLAWSLNSITWNYPTSYTGAGVTAPVVSLANRSVSNLLMANDLGVQVTFSNTFTPTGRLGDFVWDDLNANGVQDAGEPGIAGLTVTLGGSASATTTTDANGAYLFSGLTAGNYTVTVGTPSGYLAAPSNQGGDPGRDSNGSPASVTLATDVSVDLTIDFGFVKVQGPACTLTQGYWKNHGERWDAVADGTPFLTTSIFYNSGQTYLTIMKTPPAKGNAYLQLAHQFIAASLNTNGGTSGIASVDAALSGAASYFAAASAGTPAPSGALRTQVQAWASTLDKYNNGKLGTPHCD